MSFLTALSLIVGIATGSISVYRFIESRQRPITLQPSIVFGVIAIVMLVTAFIFSNIPPPPTNNVRDNGTSSTISQGPTVQTPSSPQEQPTLPPTPPPPGTVLYQADWSNGLNGWNGTSDWKALDRELLNDGTQSGTVVAPYQVEGTVNYAVEVRLRVIRNSTCFSISLRGTSVTEDKAYKGGVCMGVARIEVNRDILATTPFDDGNAWHIYRVEVKGTTIRLFIDGGLATQTQENRYLSGGQVWLGSYYTELDVSSFKVIAL